MPETLGGLALFAALLVPGFVYLERRESRQAGQQFSPLRETGQILFASLVCDAVIVGLLAFVRGVAPGITPDIGAFVREGGAFGRIHYRELFAWSAVALGGACTLAALAAVPPRFADWVVGFIRPDPELPSRQEMARRRRPPIASESAWSAAYFLYPERVPHLGVTLGDGTYLFGRLLTCNPQVEETAERSFVLAAPITIRVPDGAPQPLDADTVVISADQIRYVAVSYLPDVLPVITPTIDVGTA